MKTYGWSLQYVRFGLTGAQSWAWYAAALEMELGVFGGPAFQRTTPGYVRQETVRLMKMVTKG
jgi:hypothetical protein